jgi:ABC-type phosphate transport system substrate-binding protein
MLVRCFISEIKESLYLIAMRLNILLQICTISLVFTTLKGSEQIRMSASDLLADAVESRITAYSEAKELDLKFESLGSLPARQKLLDDEIDLAILAIPDDQNPFDASFSKHPIAYDVSIIAVNQDNPYGEITLESLSAIFGSSESKDFKFWSDLGLRGWGSRNIKAIASASGKSICIELFKYTALQQSSFKSTVDTIDLSEAQKILSNDVTSIGLLSRVLEDKDIKTLMVSMEEGRPAYGPSEDNVHYGDYPLRLPFYVVYKNANASKVKPILSLLFGKEFSEMLKESYYFALPDTVRSQYLFEFNMKRGEN